MSVCPQCQTPIAEGTFGLLKCPSCSAMMSVDIMGDAILATPDMFDAMVTEEPAAEALPSETSAPASADMWANQNSSTENSPVSNEDPFSAMNPPEIVIEPVTSTEEPVQMQESADSENLAPAEPVHNVDPAMADHFNNYKEDTSVKDLSDDQVVEEKTLSSFEVHKTGYAPDMSAKDMKDQLQKEMDAEAQMTPWVYDLVISQIVSQDDFTDILHVLRDPRLKLDVDVIKRTYNSGNLRISSLSPVKLNYIVSQMTHLKVEINWSQNVFKKPSPIET